MSSDLIAGVVALALGLAVVVLGLRRDLSEVTRSWLPRWDTPEDAPAAPGPQGGGREHRDLSPRQRRLLAAFYFLFAILWASEAVFWADDRLLHGVLAGLWVVTAVVLVSRDLRLRGGSRSGAG